PNSLHINKRIKDSEEIVDGTADAVVTYIGSQPQRILAMGFPVNIIRPEEYGVDFYGYILFSTKRFAYHSTDTTDAFIKASLKGWKYAIENVDEIIDYILTLPDVKSYGTTRQELNTEAIQIRRLIMPELVEIGHTNLGRWQYMLNIFQKLDIADDN